MVKYGFRVIIIFTVFSAIMFNHSLSIWAQIAGQTKPPGVLSGTIISPSNGSNVSRHFDVEGTVFGRHRHLWIIERIGSMHWPKEPELMPQENKWRGEVNEGGHPPGGWFQILLADVSDNVSQMFREWLERGHRTGSYPGIPESRLGDIIRLDEKRYHLEE
jgi:hypothetical protein